MLLTSNQSVPFTGRVTEAELAHERPDEYERLQREGGLAALREDPPPVWLLRFGRTIGTIAVATGLVLVGLILYAVLT